VDLMTLTPEDVRNKQFSTVRLREGYEMDEVDAFLDEVEGELTRLGRENDDLRTRLTVTSRQPAAEAPPAAAAPPAPQPAPPPQPPAPEPAVPAAVAASVTSDNAVRMLELAQRTADEHVAQAKNEAERILAEARVGAAKLTSDAQREHVILQARVEELKAFEREYRTRLRSYLENQLHDLDQMGPAVTVSPGSAQSSGAPPAAPAAPAAAPSHPSTAAPAGQQVSSPAQQAPAAPSTHVAPASAPAPAPAQTPAQAPSPSQTPATVPAGAPSQNAAPARPNNPFGPPSTPPGQPPSGPPSQA
jgi:DivIVA domain-containing protein